MSGIEIYRGPLAHGMLQLSWASRYHSVLALVVTVFGRVLSAVMYNPHPPFQHQFSEKKKFGYIIRIVFFQGRMTENRRQDRLSLF